MLDHFPQLNPVYRQRPRTVEVRAGHQVQCAGELSERSLKGGGPPPGCACFREQEEAGAYALRSDHFKAMRNPGVSQDLTGLAAAVQLRLRVALLSDGH